MQGETMIYQNTICHDLIEFEEYLETLVLEKTWKPNQQQKMRDSHSCLGLVSIKEQE